MLQFTVHKVPKIYEIDQLVGLNIFKANLLKICYRRDINNNMKTVMNKPHNQKQEQEKEKTNNHTSTHKREKSIVILACMPWRFKNLKQTKR